MGSLINESKVIYIDSDFLVLSNLSDVYDKELNGNIILASKDVDTTDGLPNHLSIDCPFVDPKEVESFFYYNTGFLLVDLDSWRDYGVEESALNLIQNYKGHLNAWDQTILNYILRGRIGNLDPSFCWSSSLGKIPYPGNIHYISKQKPWNGWSIIASYKLWYMFYRIFLKDIFPIEISLKQKIKGILQYHRDAIFEKANFLLLFYQNYLIKKVGSRSAALYTFSIRRNSERKQHPDWKCVALISSLSRKWSLRKTSLIHNKDASAS